MRSDQIVTPPSSHPSTPQVPRHEDTQARALLDVHRLFRCDGAVVRGHVQQFGPARRCPAHVQRSRGIGHQYSRKQGVCVCVGERRCIHVRCICRCRCRCEWRCGCIRCVLYVGLCVRGSDGVWVSMGGSEVNVGCVRERRKVCMHQRLTIDKSQLLISRSYREGNMTRQSSHMGWCGLRSLAPLGTRASWWPWHS